MALSTAVFLDIEVGDRTAYDIELAKYERAKVFLNTSGDTYGLPLMIEELLDEQHDVLIDVYNGMHGDDAEDIRTTSPAPLHGGRLVIDLADDECPKASENFRALCTGEKGMGKVSKKPLCYKGCMFHRGKKGFMIQGGDITRGDGSGGESIYGKTFKDEKGGLKLRHDAAGIVSMANSGKNSNSSQFFITFAPAPTLDNKYVVIGRIRHECLSAVLPSMEAACNGSGIDGAPTMTVRIVDCGVTM